MAGAGAAGGIGGEPGASGGTIGEGGGNAGGGGVAGGGGATRQQGSKVDPATPEGGVEAFLKALVSQDQEGLSKSISSKAVGDLGKLRKGEADSNVMTKLSDTYGRLYVIRVANATRGDERLVVLSATQQQADKKTGSFKQIRVRKEEGIWKVADFK
jgi:hypothetical protein